MKMKKAAMIFLAAVLACGSFACGNREGDEEIDETKTQLYVTTFEGGYGAGWLEAIKTRFEAAYAGRSFEKDKEGVQVIIKEDRNLTNDYLKENLAGSTQEVFFTEAVNYYDLQGRNLFYNITDAVTSNIAGESTSIEGKMRDIHKDYFKADDGNYYGIPFYEANYGIVYDIDLFEENNLYFAETGKGDKGGFITEATMTRSKGPDNQAGTADDGLPATYDDFFKLCDRMVLLGITPITWSGKNPHYVNALAEALQADYEGEEQMRINYTFTGKATNLVKEVKADGSLELYEEEITPENGYLTWTRQAGKYYSLKFVERLTANENYYPATKVISPSYEHIDSQDDFITGRFMEAPIGMLVDGSWWHNEASETFKALTIDRGEFAGAQARKFGFMPLPKATADKLGEQTILEANSSICFVNGNLDKKKEPLVKEFLQFCHTNKSLAEFTSLTYTCKPYTYTMTDAEVKAMPFWGQELYRLHKEAKFVSNYSKSPVYKANAGTFTEYFDGTMYESTVTTTNGKEITVKVIPSAMIEDNVSAIDFFNGLALAMTEERWSREFLPNT